MAEEKEALPHAAADVVATSEPAGISRIGDPDFARGSEGEREAEEGRAVAHRPSVAEGPSDAESPLPPPPFGSANPRERARRLARALVSDIAVYHPDRRDRSLQQGTIRQEFREEIRKSWEEYVSQVGNEIARETSYFQEALNEILAGGARLF